LSSIEANWPALFVFLPAWFIACAGIIYISGNLPLRFAPRDVQMGVGPALVWINVAALVVLILVAGTYAFASLRWTSTVVAGGFALLFAPFVVQGLPDRMRDTRWGLIVLLCLNVVALVFVRAITNN